ncbi:hypothetical protein NEMIN01_1558 [Nematocida minor]|uniref:uncharacterized protein n=1 Tax=Nematocida minor TaxID=1912983 RepID=UPI002220DC52|nr:uncharacterized protein NEMIN01_1558 [Nematocida minor]KAI5191532.1 hypothetical protein NEMIN01_1558 [Nematocida minor]
MAEVADKKHHFNKEKRMQAIFELFESESEYAYDLTLWTRTIKHLVVNTSSLEVYSKQIFLSNVIGNSDELFKLHDTILLFILNKLSITRNTPKDVFLRLDISSQSLSEILHAFIVRKDIISKVYIEYATRIPQATGTMAFLLEQNKSFNAEVSDVLHRINRLHLGCSHFIMRPMQKITRYPLLMQAILKYALPEEIPDLQTAIMHIQQINMQVNQNVQYSTEYFTLYHLAHEIQYAEKPLFSVGMMQKERKLVKLENDILVKTNKGTKSVSIVILDNAVFFVECVITIRGIYKNTLKTLMDNKYMAPDTITTRRIEGTVGGEENRGDAESFLEITSNGDKYLVCSREWIIDELEEAIEEVKTVQKSKMYNFRLEELSTGITAEGVSMSFITPVSIEEWSLRGIGTLIVGTNEYLELISGYNKLRIFDKKCENVVYNRKVSSVFYGHKGYVYALPIDGSLADTAEYEEDAEYDDANAETGNSTDLNANSNNNGVGNSVGNSETDSSKNAATLGSNKTASNNDDSNNSSNTCIDKPAEDAKKGGKKTGDNNAQNKETRDLTDNNAGEKNAKKDRGDSESIDNPNKGQKMSNAGNAGNDKTGDSKKDNEKSGGTANAHSDANDSNGNTSDSVESTEKNKKKDKTESALNTEEGSKKRKKSEKAKHYETNTVSDNRIDSSSESSSKSEESEKDRETEEDSAAEEAIPEETAEVVKKNTSRVISMLILAASVKDQPKSMIKSSDMFFIREAPDAGDGVFLVAKKIGYLGSEELVILKIDVGQNGNASKSMYKRMYIAGNVKDVSFFGKNMVISSNDFELIDLVDLTTQELLDPLDKTIAIYVNKIDSTPLFMEKTEENVYLVAFDDVGFFINRLGSRKRAHIVFLWLMQIRSVFIFKEFVVALGEKQVKIFSLKDGMMRGIFDIENGRHLEHPDYIIIYNDTKIYRITFLDQPSI